MITVRFTIGFWNGSTLWQLCRPQKQVASQLSVVPAATSSSNNQLQSKEQSLVVVEDALSSSDTTKTKQTDKDNASKRRGVYNSHKLEYKIIPLILFFKKINSEQIYCLSLQIFVWKKMNE